MAFPVVTVEAAWGDVPNAATPTWFEIPNWRAIEISRGRQVELGTFSPGTATVVCSDRDRQLDPTNTAATHAGDLLPMRRLRIKALYNAVTYYLFTGYLDSFEHAYAGPHGGDVTATLTATDGFKVLAAAQLPSSVYEMEVQADNPALWWRLDEPADTATAYDSSGAGRHGLYFGAALQRSAAGLIVNDSSKAIKLPDGAGRAEHSYATSGFAVDGTKPWAVEFWFNMSAEPSASFTRFFEQMASGTNYISLARDTPTGQFQFAVANSALTIFGVQTSIGLVANTTYHIVAKQAVGGTLQIYVNGTDYSSTFAPYGSTVSGTIPKGDIRCGSTLTAPATVDEFAIYVASDAATDPLPAARIQSHYLAGSAPLIYDDPGVRVNRILDMIAWPGTLEDVDPAVSGELQAAELDMTALAHLQKVAASDFGALYISADGKVTFIGRDNLWNRASVGVFGDDPADPTELGYRSLRPQYTDGLIRNDVIVSRANGKAHRVEDTASIDAYLRHSYVIDGLWHTDDDLSLDAANFFVSEYAQPRRRISNLTIAPQGDPADLFPQVLDRELLDVVTVIDRPAGGVANEQDASIEGIAHTIRPLWWETRWNLSPAFGTGGVGALVGVWDETNWDNSRWAF